QISIGEMGGRGRYDWDGVPMSFLVRHALEKCSSLEQVKNLWLKAPRTCEYFYVFSDGKIPDAVGVRATSKEIEFLAPGQSHFFIGEGIPDTVIMSAGDRLKLLRERITAGHGNFDFPAALKLMDRPVAMKSNLHNVLFVPASGDIYLAIATASEPAAEQKYVRFNLQEILADRH
ncbi:MAG: peptidase C45 acyl-coenzyme A:6-aminopenicillanic acid acyl-transferase, partial [Candidatus Rifleibacteriota bacterium]